MTIIAIPMTIVSIFLTLQIAVLGLQAFDLIALRALVDTLPLPPLYKTGIAHTPVIITLHALITVLMLSDISFKIKKSSIPQIIANENDPSDFSYGDETA